VGLAAVAAGAVIFVADSRNARIRMITPDGTTTTLAGNDELKRVDGKGVNASFQHPVSLVADTSGNVYVADTASHCIRRIDDSGDVRTIVGTGTPVPLATSKTVSIAPPCTATSAQLTLPTAVCVDSHARALYIAEGYDSRIRKFDMHTGMVTTYAGSLEGSIDGPLLEARFGRIAGMVLDSRSDIYITDFLYHCVRKISTGTGKVSTFAGKPGEQGWKDGKQTEARFSFPVSIAVDQAHGDTLYVADAGNRTFRRISREGVVTTLHMRETWDEPSGVTVCGNSLYLSDSMKCGVWAVDLTTLPDITPAQVILPASTPAETETDKDCRMCSSNNSCSLM